MDTAGSWVGLRLDPLDPLFFRDGRPFDAATRASGGLPQPQTLAGALRTALLARTGFDFRKFSPLRKDDPARMRESLRTCGAPDAVIDAAFRGPWLALASGDERDGPVTPLLPMPETLKRAKGGGWSEAKPVVSVPGWPEEKDEPLRPLWRKERPDPKADAELLTLAGLEKFLKGNGESIQNNECVKRDDLFGYDHRVGIEVDKETLTSADGMLYVISLLATKREIPLERRNPDDQDEEREKRTVCLYAEMTLPTELHRHFTDTFVVPFGGEGKYVQVKKIAAQSWHTLAPDPKHSMWYLATPTFFPPTGRSLPKITGLVAAASGAGVPVSGWDAARNGPRGTRFAVPAGAVYFVEGACSGDDFLDLGLESDALRQEGWGFALPGTWEGLPK